MSTPPGSTTTTSPTEPFTCREPPPPPTFERFEVARVTNYVPVDLPEDCDFWFAQRSACMFYGPSVGDMDGDGVIELIWNGYQDGDRYWPIDELHPGVGGGPPTLVPDPVWPSLDALVRGSDLGGRYQPVPEARVAIAGIADVDGDGDQDILHGAFWDEGMLVAMEHDGQGHYVPMLAPAPQLGPRVGWVESADLVDWDNDGRLDFAAMPRWPVTPEFLGENWSLDLYLRNDDSWVSVPWAVQSLSAPIDVAAQLGMLEVFGERTWMMAGNVSTDETLAHPILYQMDDTVDPEGIPTAVPMPPGGPASTDGPMMGGGMIEWLVDEGDGPTRVPVVLSTVDNKPIQAHRRFGSDTWVDVTRQLMIEPSPNSFQGAGPTANYQLPWYVWPLDDTTFAVANGDDAWSWASVDGVPYQQNVFFDQNQVVDFFQADGHGGFQRVTDQALVDGGEQPSGSFIGFYERDGVAVWLASWIDEANPYGRIMRSWVAERIDPPGHHWVSVAPQGTTSNRPGIGAEVFFTEDPACADELTELLMDDRHDELATACGACGYARQVVGEPDAGHVMTSPEVRIYMGAEVGGLLPTGTVLIDWPSGTLQRLDDVEPGRLEPVEPATVDVTQDATGATIRVLPVDAYGQPLPLTGFGPGKVSTVGVPVGVATSIDPDGTAVIRITAPQPVEVDDWVANHRFTTVSTQVRIEGVDQRPRLFW